LPKSREPDLLCELLMEIGAVATGMTDANVGTERETAIFGEPVVGTVDGGARHAHSVWDVCNVTAYFPDSVDVREVVDVVRSSFLYEPDDGDVDDEDRTRTHGVDGALKFDIQTVDDRDWIVHVQQSWKPIVVGRFVLKFPWHDEETVQRALKLSVDDRNTDEPGNREETVVDPIVLELQGGIAFGTGEHATTQLCLGWIDSVVSESLRRNSITDTSSPSRAPPHVLDYGAGSGILGLAACALDPAVSCVGIDLDVDACRIANENARRNRLSMRSYLPPSSLLRTNPDDAESQSLLLKAHRQAKMFPRNNSGEERNDSGGDTPEILPEEMNRQEFPIVVANILAAPLVQLAPSLMKRVAPGGRLGLSGVLHHQADSVLRAYEREGLDQATVLQRQGDWVLIAGTKACY
jgi:ribosomal protein L11 methyltransferase